MKYATTKRTKLSSAQKRKQLAPFPARLAPTQPSSRRRLADGLATRATDPETGNTRKNKFIRNKTSTNSARKGGLPPFGFVVVERPLSAADAGNTVTGRND